MKKKSKKFNFFTFTIPRATSLLFLGIFFYLGLVDRFSDIGRRHLITALVIFLLLLISWRNSQNGVIGFAILSPAYLFLNINSFLLLMSFSVSVYLLAISCLFILDIDNKPLAKKQIKSKITGNALHTTRPVRLESKHSALIKE